MSYGSVIHPGGLKLLAANYLHDVDLSPIDKAWELAVQVHQGGKHFSGEPYLIHVLEVASTLASMHLDLDTILAGLLHGALKNGVSFADLEKQFGSDVAYIVSGTTKITSVQYNNKLTSQAENVRRMLLAMAKDIRVLLVRLIDRLQDMLLLDLVDRPRQLEVARETMDLFAPLAGRLGIDWLKRQLEDFSFKYLYPAEFDDLNERLESSLEERQRYVDETISILYAKLREGNVSPTRILGRPKHLYSIYKKLVVQNIPLERVYDKVAFRIIVANVKGCYEALGIVHANWAPVPGRIKDFISVPKANNYQSMHTTVVGPHEHFIEIQIRTEEMDRVAQEGIAAHWAYKEGQKVDDRDARLFRELKKLVTSLQDVEDSREFLESLRGELHDPEVFALTPNGEVREFPAQSCPIDFAYAIHTEVGNHCAGAKVNGRLVPLKYELQNGDIVEIITSPNQRPRRGWLDMVKTSRARARIRSWLRREENEKALLLGREICERELKKHDMTLKRMVKSGHIKLLLKTLRCNSLDDMLIKVGSGAITIQNLLKALDPPEMRQDNEATAQQLSPEELAASMVSQQRGNGSRSGSAISIDGIDDMLAKVSLCCHPVPGDPIVGFITTGRGVSVHKADCPNLLSSDPQRWIEVYWNNPESQQYRAEIQVITDNSKGIFVDISSAVAADMATIVEISAHKTPADTVEFSIALEIRDLEHLQVLLKHLRQMESVISARRV
ncbi:MAG: bifunctional (p)ppGpp synthetase/guanosine-3',5'-bis(diphosphate) 3'-pyrophosphohydrolase [Desulfobulbaceae bacterium]|nr:bifunctional (p)ppGpp synthetase/guanosine-3',5'-bis(diphosphate) 3'-pyrophosphohydrolase [Desulfobulbaceae bacterium]